MLGHLKILHQVDPASVPFKSKKQEKQRKALPRHAWGNPGDVRDVPPQNPPFFLAKNQWMDPCFQEKLAKDLEEREKNKDAPKFGSEICRPCCHVATSIWGDFPATGTVFFSAGGGEESTAAEAEASSQGVQLELMGLRISIVPLTHCLYLSTIFVVQHVVSGCEFNLLYVSAVQPGDNFSMSSSFYPPLCWRMRPRQKRIEPGEKCPNCAPQFHS